MVLTPWFHWPFQNYTYNVLALLLYNYEQIAQIFRADPQIVGAKSLKSLECKVIMG
jgi:hypothetical protein